MTVFAWQEEYSVGIREIDEQHKKLVAMVNDMHQALAQGKGREILGAILNKLIAYTQYHFGSEEALMEKYAFPDFPAHRLAHTSMSTKVLALHKEFAGSDIKRSIEVARFLQQWLNKHILETDKQYSSFLKKKGVS
ncbi:MAG: bacteriohemerythrin [Deltaproteobacteria bacterium]|nr:bacteriohemerythrin [Deltaproteobacteria bacterium]